jgi:hypothetical protein
MTEKEIMDAWEFLLEAINDIFGNDIEVEKE